MTDLSHPSSTKEDTPNTTLLNSKAAFPQESYNQEVKPASLLGGVVPTEKDILCCRGLTATEHPGNVLFRAIVRTYIPRYSSLFGCNAAASLLYWEITQTLQREHGARFLRRQGDVWIIVDDEEARKKTAREVRKQQQKEAQRAKKEEMSAIRRKYHQLEQKVMKLGDNKEQPSSRAVGKTIRKKPRGSLWSFKAEIARIMGEESEENEDYNEQQQEDGREEDGTTAASCTTSSSSTSDGSSSDHDKWYPSNIVKPPPNHKNKQQIFLKPYSVGEEESASLVGEEESASPGGSMVLVKAVKQVPPSSSGRRNFLVPVSQNRPPEEDKYSFSGTRGRMMTRSPQHQHQHFLMSGPSSTNYIGDDAYHYRQFDHGSILVQGERGSGGRGGVSSNTVLSSPRLEAATSYYHDHHQQGKQYDYINEDDYDDERLPVADFFLE